MISAGMRLVLETVRDFEPIRFEGVVRVIDGKMCERILGSHLTRLRNKGFLVYDKGIYTITDEGRELLDDGD
jgi:DNA-binding HxlR family transcriptional regulator